MIGRIFLLLVLVGCLLLIVQPWKYRELSVESTKEEDNKEKEKTDNKENIIKADVSQFAVEDNNGNIYPLKKITASIEVDKTKIENN